MTIPQIPLDFNSIIPEIILTSLASLLLLLGLMRINRAVLVWSAVIVILSVIPIIPIFEGKAFGEFFLNDSLSVYIKIILLLGTILSLLLLSSSLSRGYILIKESLALVVFASTGMMLLVSCRELISFFVSLELMSLSLYALVAIRKYDIRANEAAIKYFMLGGLSTVITLFGIALIYGATKSTDFIHIIKAVNTSSELLIGGLSLFIVGFCFKIALVPFHMWAPDVYEGAPTSVTAFISTVPKVAILGAFARILIEIFPAYHLQWSSFLILFSILSMAIGNILALSQKNIKRMLAYSGIAHGGYVILGLIAGTQAGLNAVVTYMLVYTFMNIGAFAVVIALNEESIENYKGIHKYHPLIAFVMLIFMFSLTGVPPTVGFIVKFNVFLQAIKAGLVWLVIIAVLFTVVSAYYYLRVVMFMYMKEPLKRPAASLSRDVEIVLALCAIGSTILGILPLFLI